MFEILPNFHPILVHFTVALFSVATALFMALFLAKNLSEQIREQCRIVAYWNLWLAAGFTLITVLAGHHAYSSVAHDAPSHAAMTDHRNWAFATFLLLEGLAAWAISLNRKTGHLSHIFIAALLVTQLVLLSTAWRGGELVYRYGLGVLSLPATGTNGHDHHTDDASHGHSSPENSSPEPATPIDTHAHDDAHSDADPHEH